MTLSQQVIKGWWFRLRLDTRFTLCTLVFVAVAFVVLQPIILLLVNSFQVGQFSQDVTWGFSNWVTAFGAPELRKAVGNTLTLTLTSQGLAFAVALPLAWLFARTDLPAREWLEFGFWINFFLPPLTVMVGWIFLLSGGYGLINQLWLKLPFTSRAPFDIFSWWGIVFTHLVTGLISIKVLLLTPAFRNLDASLEEASRTCGASAVNTFVRVVLPIMTPAVGVVALLGTIRSLESFEIEYILGAPRRIDVYSTLIYRYMQQTVPEYGNATVLSVFTLGFILPLVLIQQWLTSRRSYVTLSGRYSGRRYSLGRLRWPLFGAICLLFVLIGIAPLLFVILSTCMTVFGYFSIADPWTSIHWQTVLSDPIFLRSLKNTLVLGCGAAAAAMGVYPIVAYISGKTSYGGRQVLDFITWMPTAIPGIVMSLGILWFFLMAPVFRPLYGTVSILVMAIFLARMTTGVQVIKSNMLQVSAELEEMSAASGASWFNTFRRIVLPLIAPSIAVVGLLTFAAGVRNVGHVALLSTGNIQPLSILQLNYLEDGSLERASVVGVIVLVLIVLVAVVARVVGLKLRSSGD